MDPDKCVIYGPKAIHVEFGRWILSKIVANGNDETLKDIKMKRDETLPKYSVNFMDIVDHYVPPESETDSESDDDCDDIECISDDSDCED